MIATVVENDCEGTIVVVVKFFFSESTEAKATSARRNNKGAGIHAPLTCAFKY